MLVPEIFFRSGPMSRTHLHIIYNSNSTAWQFLPLLMLMASLIYLCSSMCRRSILIPLMTAASIFIWIFKERLVDLYWLKGYYTLCDVNIWLLLLCLMPFLPIVFSTVGVFLWRRSHPVPSAIYKFLLLSWNGNGGFFSMLLQLSVSYLFFFSPLVLYTTYHYLL